MKCCRSSPETFQVLLCYCSVCTVHGLLSLQLLQCGLAAFAHVQFCETRFVWSTLDTENRDKPTFLTSHIAKTLLLLVCSAHTYCSLVTPFVVVSTTDSNYSLWQLIQSLLSQRVAININENEKCLQLRSPSFLFQKTHSRKCVSWDTKKGQQLSEANW